MQQVKQTRLIPASDWNKSYEWPPIGGLRHLIFNARSNGFNTVIHRVGRLQPGDQIVLVAVSSAHRGAAFQACEFLMDYLKTQAPFWKKETTPEGARWVDARLHDSIGFALADRVVGSASFIGGFHFTGHFALAGVFDRGQPARAPDAPRPSRQPRVGSGAAAPTGRAPRGSSRATTRSTGSSRAPRSTSWWPRPSRIVSWACSASRTS